MIRAARGSAGKAAEPRAGAYFLGVSLFGYSVVGAAIFGTTTSTTSGGGVTA
jgi:hypothetical protein